MKLYPVQESDSSTVARWLTDNSNRRWLDFGSAVLSPLAIQVMAQKPSHCLRVFREEETSGPIGIVALSDIHPVFRTAQLWYALGEKTYGGRGCTTRAVAQLLRVAFSELHLRCVNAWAVEANTRSISVLKANGFREAGKWRSAHEIEGRVYDRLLFDLLASEFGGSS
jgi:RimJ/RimL family protein N-acetyltransferase